MLDFIRPFLEGVTALRSVPVIYPGYVASMIRKALTAGGVSVDQHQSNGTYGAHQLRVRLPDDATIYRAIIAPADAPISIGCVDADLHFQEPIGRPS